MPVDFGRLNINTATTAEKFSADLATEAVIRASSIVTSITFKAPAANTGNVYIGRLGRDGTTATVSSTYGLTLQPGEAFAMNDINEKFDNFQGDAATSGDDIEWAAAFESGTVAKK